MFEVGTDDNAQLFARKRYAQSEGAIISAKSARRAKPGIGANKLNPKECFELVPPLTRRHLRRRMDFGVASTLRRSRCTRFARRLPPAYSLKSATRLQVRRTKSSCPTTSHSSYDIQCRIHSYQSPNNYRYNQTFRRSYWTGIASCAESLTTAIGFQPNSRCPYRSSSRRYDPKHLRFRRRIGSYQLVRASQTC